VQSARSLFDLHLSNAQIVAIEERQKVALELMNKLETLRSQQVKVYEATHRNRELLAGMRAQQREWFHTEQSRQEQRIQDDNFAARKSLR
jgi:hypothetical protein